MNPTPSPNTRRTSSWRRRLFVGGVAGLAVGLVVGGTLGRVYMRLVFLAEDESLGFTTAMGAIVGSFTAGGTFFIAVFGAIAGVLLGIAYAVTGPLLPAGVVARTAIFVVGATAFLTGMIARDNEEDFAFLPVTLSLVLTALAVALTALPVPWLVERVAPVADVTRRRPIARALVAIGMTGFLVYGISGVVIAYSVEPLF